MSTGTNGTQSAEVTETAIVAHVPDDLAVRQSPAWLDGGRLDVCVRVAQAMAIGGFVPEGFRGQNDKETAARCLRLVMMAEAWGFNPWQLADSCYMAPGGKFGIEGKVAIAVLGRSPVIAGRLRFEFGGMPGKSGERYVIVRGTLRGETEPRELRGSVAQWAKKRYSKKANGGKGGWVDPNPMWYEEGPGQDQKLAYVGAMWWGRRYAPEVLMGAMIREEEDYGLDAPPQAMPRAVKKVEPRPEPEAPPPEVPAKMLDADIMRIVGERLAAVKGKLGAVAHLRAAAEAAGIEDFAKWPASEWSGLLDAIEGHVAPDAFAEIRGRVAP